MNQGAYRSECPRCGVKLSALSAQAIMRKIGEHARLIHDEIIDWGPGQTGIPTPAPPPAEGPVKMLDPE